MTVSPPRSKPSSSPKRKSSQTTKLLGLPDRSGLWVVMDTEGGPELHPDDGHRVSCVGLDWGRGQRFLPFDQGIRDKLPNPQGSLFDEDPNLGKDAWDELWTWAARQHLVFHNAAHDVAAIRAGTRHWPGPDLIGRVGWDTLLGQWILDPLEKKALDSAGERLFGMGKSRETLDQALKSLPVGYRKRYDMVPWEAMEGYLRADVLLGRKLFEDQRRRFEDDSEDADLLEIMHREMQVFRVVAGIRRRGIGFNVSGSMQEAAKAKKLLHTVAGSLPFRPTPDAARNWFYGKQGATPHCVTAKKGTPSVGECCVRTLIAEGIPGAQEWAKYQKIHRAIGTYYEGYADRCGPDGRLRTDLQQTGTVSMRFSSQRINLQAMPHDYRMELVEGCAPIRSLIVPRPGCKLYELDISQAELRVASRIARCKKLLRAFQEGSDVHALTAGDLFSVHPEDDEFFQFRQVAKRANFSLIYSIGIDKFMADVEKQTGIKLSRDEAEAVVRGHHKLYPEFPYINKKAELRAYKNNYIKLCTGRKRWFQPYEEKHKAFNQRVQGDIAEGMKLWMIELDHQWPDTLVLQIHDSVVVEVPEGADDWIPDMQEVGAKLLTDLYRVPMIIDAKGWK